jgi:hypothetical protein
MTRFTATISHHSIARAVYQAEPLPSRTPRRNTRGCSCWPSFFPIADTIFFSRRPVRDCFEVRRDRQFLAIDVDGDFPVFRP